VSPAALDIPDEIRQRPTLADEIIDQKVASATLYLANEKRLVCEALKAASSGVPDGI
jgi:hypothetical protein